MAKKTKQPMQIRIWLDNFSSFKLKAEGDPMVMAEGLGTLMVQNDMLRNVILVASKVCENYKAIEEKDTKELVN